MKQKIIKPKKKEDWSAYTGCVWKSILKKCNIKKDGIIVEIAPGSANKVGIDLKKYNFHGTLYIMEPNEKSLNLIIKRYKKILPHCVIVGIQKTTSQGLNLLPKKVDAILSNHPLDDMIIGNSLKNHKFDGYFDHCYDGPNPKRTQRLWDNIESKPEQLKKIKLEVVTEIENLIKQTSPKLLAISQYRSYFFQKNKIFAPDKHAFDVLKVLRNKFSKYDNSDILKNEKEVKDPNRWLVLDSPLLKKQKVGCATTNRHMRNSSLKKRRSGPQNRASERTANKFQTITAKFKNLK